MVKLVLRFLSHPGGVLFITILAGLFAWSLLSTLGRFDRSARYAQELSTTVGSLQQEVDGLKQKAVDATSSAAQEKIIRNELLLQQPTDRVIQLPAISPFPSSSPAPTPLTPPQQWQALLK